MPDLKKLLAQEAKLKAQIKEAKAKEAKKEAAIHALRCRIVGSAILAEMEDYPDLKEQLMPIIEKRTLGKRERLMMGFEVNNG